MNWINPLALRHFYGRYGTNHSLGRQCCIGMNLSISLFNPKQEIMSPFDWVFSKRRWRQPPHPGRSNVIDRGSPGKRLTNRPPHSSNLSISTKKLEPKLRVLFSSKWFCKSLDRWMNRPAPGNSVLAATASRGVLRKIIAGQADFQVKLTSKNMALPESVPSSGREPGRRPWSHADSSHPFLSKMITRSAKTRAMQLPKKYLNL